VLQATEIQKWSNENKEKTQKLILKLPWLTRINKLKEKGRKFYWHGAWSKGQRARS